MKIAVLGTGTVGETIGSRLVELGHEVMMGSRSATNEKAAAWSARAGKKASAGDFAAAAEFAQVVFNCTKGEASLEALAMAGDENLAGKVVVDVANVLDFSKGFPPSLGVCNTDSLGEQIQRAHPQARVVKALNTMWCGIMVNPRQLPEHHTTFICGNDGEAKETVRRLLAEFGWEEDEIIELGDITAARGTEMLLPIWIRLYSNGKTGAFNFKVVSAASE